MTKILLIDDDRLTLMNLDEELRNAGYEILETSNGAEALELARRAPLDLALVNINLPDVPGTEVARELRENLNIYSLLLTDHEERKLVKEAANSGTLGCLVTPISTTEIILAIETALHVSGELAQLRDSKERLVRTQTTNRHISVAIGIYMERFHVSQIEAFETLRAYARSERRKLASVCEELVLATDRRNELTNRIYYMEKTAAVRKIKSNKKRGPSLIDDQ